MTVYDLMSGTTVVGRVQVSYFTNNLSTEIVLLRNAVSDLAYEIDDLFEDCKVDFICSSDDGYIHIELDEDDVKEVLHNALENAESNLNKLIEDGNDDSPYADFVRNYISTIKGWIA